MIVYTGHSRLMEPALIALLRRGLEDGAAEQIVVVPKQLTLQTERALLAAVRLNVELPWERGRDGRARVHHSHALPQRGKHHRRKRKRHLLRHDIAP